jgi:hypothetical protein
MDEVPSGPCDAQPDEYEMALAAHRVERTVIKVGRIAHRWRDCGPSPGQAAGCRFRI